MSGDSNSDFFNKIGEALGDAFEKGRQEIVRSARVGRLSMDQRALETDRERLLMRIGRLAVDALQAGEIAHESLTEPLERLTALEDRIAQLEGRRKKLKEGLADSEQKGNTPAPVDGNADEEE